MATLTVTLTARSTFDASKDGSTEITVTDRASTKVALCWAALTTEQGTRDISDVTLTCVGPFTAAVESMPNVVLATTNPTTISSGTTASCVTVAVSAAVVPGTYALTAHGKSQGVSDATSVLTLIIPIPPGLSFAVASESLAVVAGRSGTAKARVASVGGFASQVALPVDAPPAGIAVSFAASQLALGDSTALTARVGASVTPGR